MAKRLSRHDRNTVDAQSASVSRTKRDSQRQKVYDSERSHSLWKSAVQVDFDGWRLSNVVEFEDGTPVPSVSEVQSYVNKLTRGRWFKNRWPRYSYDKNKTVWSGGSVIKRPHGILVLDGRRRRSATGSINGSISMPRWSRFTLVILHEITHVVTGTSRTKGAHGRTFCANYLALIRHELGVDAANEMKQLFKEHRVKYTRPKALKTRRK